MLVYSVENKLLNKMQQKVCQYPSTSETKSIAGAIICGKYWLVFGEALTKLNLFYLGQNVVLCIIWDEIQINHDLF